MAAAVRRAGVARSGGDFFSCRYGARKLCGVGCEASNAQARCEAALVGPTCQHVPPMDDDTVFLKGVKIPSHSFSVTAGGGSRVISGERLIH
jgi:hypothetical protein